MVKSSVPHSQFDLNTNLQAVAVNVTLSKKVTICSIYLPPNDVLSKNSLVNLINQLPQPFMLVGNFNGHSKVWGCSDTNDRGELIEDVIAENDLCLLNEKQPTYLHPPTENYYAIDLSLCHPNIYLDFKARRTIKDAKRSSWRQYVNKLNSRTPIKVVIITNLEQKQKSA